MRECVSECVCESVCVCACVCFVCVCVCACVCFVCVCVCVYVCVSSYVDLTGYSAVMGTLFRDPKVGEPDRRVISLTKIVCGPSESHLVMLQLETYVVYNTHRLSLCLSMSLSLFLSLSHTHTNTHIDG